MLNRYITSIFSILLSLVLIGAALLLLKPRLADVIFAFDYVTSQMLSDVRSAIQTNAESDEKWKEGGSAEYKKRLMSIDPNVRLKAIHAIQEKGDPQFVPQIIKLLNDNTPIVELQSSGASQIREVAKNALVKLLRDNVVREPGDIAQLLPLFEAGRNGSRPEKLGTIDILHALREPTAYPLLKNLSETTDDPEIASRASKAMRSLTPNSVLSDDYYLITNRRVEFMYLLMAFGIIMIIASIVGLLRRKGTQFAILCLLAMVLNIGLGVLVHAELNRGTLTRKSLQHALSTGDLYALRTMCYTDNASYFGDSFFCQDIVQIGGLETFSALVALPGVEPDDTKYLKKNFQSRTRWIMSRIIMLNLGKPTLELIINSADPNVAFAIAETLDKLNVQNDEIKHCLERLSYHKKENVRKLAEKALSQIKGLPVWPFTGRSD